MGRLVRRTAGALGWVAAAGRALLLIPVGYLSVLTVAAWWATLVRRGQPAGLATVPTASILVPAHDEETVIGATLTAMAALDYPPDRFQVHVVADHCSDRTVPIAREAGVDVLEHEGVERGKGRALEWAIARVLDAHDPEMVVIVDADTIVDPGLLYAIAQALNEGASVVQGEYRVGNAGASASAGLRAAALASRHHVRPLGRTTLGGSCGLYGNGMAFRADVLRGRSWTNHLTEDLELQMELLLDGIPVHYAPDAVVASAMPTTFEAARTQNERWERGRIELARRYVPRLLHAAIARPGRSRVQRRAALDGVLDHVVPPMSVLAALTGGVAVVGTAAALVEGGRGRHRLGWGLLAALVGHVVSSLVMVGAPRSVYRSLLHAPASVLWKVRLWARMLLRRDQMDWVRTVRTGEELVS